MAPAQIDDGNLFAEIRIDSTGGAHPINSHGHTRGGARRLRELVEDHRRPNARS